MNPLLFVCLFITENNVSSFLHLLKSYIKDSGIGEDQQELCRCIPIIGAILQRVNVINVLMVFFFKHRNVRYGCVLWE